MTRVMAIVLNYNSINDCKKCVQFLQKQIDLELVITIVDNNSNCDKEELINFSCEKDVLLIENHENRGYSAGNNIGLRKAYEYGCEYAMIINPDVELRDSRYVAQAIQVMDGNNEIAILGTDILNIHGQHQNPMREVSYMEELLWPLEILKNKLSKRLPYVCDYHQSSYCYKVSGCCFFIRMEFAQSINYLDESVFLYCEEPILAATVAREEKKAYYLHSITAHHIHNASTKGDPKKRLNEFYKSRVYYLENYSGHHGMALKLALLSRKLQKEILIRKNL